MSERGRRAHAHILKVQDTITGAIEAIDGKERFIDDEWDREGGGGGRTRVIQGGDVFEKGGVNVSCVHGEMSEAFAGQVPGDGRSFFATGISLILHPRSPRVPTVHANFRYLEKGEGEGRRTWFGGGADLTPYVLYEDDARHFHSVWKAVCGRHEPVDHQHLKQWCDRYFHLPHRGEARGVGGIFYDYVGLPAGEHDNAIPAALDAAEAFAFDASRSFLDAYVPIVERRKDEAYDDALRQWQLIRRGRYVEFNLIHDRGTLFGLKTGGRIESILVSLPDPVRWLYDHQPEPGTYQETLVDALRNPREWT